MKTETKAGETQTSWKSHKHPDNLNFMQVVSYLHIQYPDGRNNLHWSLANATANDHHMIPGITRAEALSRFADSEEDNIEDEFQNWLLKIHI